jgi:integrase
MNQQINGHIRPKGKRFLADITLDSGKRLRPSFKTWDEADRWLAQVNDRMVRGLPIERMVQDVSPTVITLRKAAEETLDRHWKGVKSELTLWRNAKDVFMRLGPNLPVRDIDESAIDELVYELERDGKSNGTINRKLAALSKILRHSYRRGYIKRLPSIERKRESQGRLRWLQDHEEPILLDCFSQLERYAMRDFVMVLIDTGLRTGELLKLTWADVDQDQEVVRLWETKNGQARSIPVTQRAMEALLRQQGNHEVRVFTFTQDAFSNVWKRVREMMGMLDDQNFVPHMLRHTCASRLIQRGVDLRVVKEWMGHTSIQTTLRYAHLAPKNLFTAREVLEPNRAKTVPNLAQMAQ